MITARTSDARSTALFISVGSATPRIRSITARGSRAGNMASLATPQMNLLMAIAAKRDEVFLPIPSQKTSRLLMMDLQIL